MGPGYGFYSLSTASSRGQIKELIPMVGLISTVKCQLAILLRKSTRCTIFFLNGVFEEPRGKMS